MTSTKEVSKMWIYITHCSKKTFNAPVTLVETKDCIKKLFKTVKPTLWISEIIR